MANAPVITVPMISIFYHTGISVVHEDTMTDYTTIDKIHLLLATKMADAKMAKRYRYEIGGN